MPTRHRDAPASQAEPVPQTRKRTLRRWGLLVVLAGLMAVGFVLGWHKYLTLSELIRNRALLADMVEQNLALTVTVYCLVYVAAVALSFPGASLLTMAGGLLFGAFAGGTMTDFAATLGAVIIFLVARTSFGHTFSDRAGPMMKRLAKGLREDAFNYLFFLRLTPIFPFWLVNAAPALVNVPLCTYTLATFIGILPGTYAYVFLGSDLDSLIAAQEKADPGCAAQGTCQIDPSALITCEMIVALGLVSLIPVGAKKLRRKRSGDGA
ncbi:TVP38/TMEM64 family protein [Breoghania sp.]|uniref:TVP38/TMEM64 family protein n=1 Tax=Breoghania sp. TaxID=2065378 RepID=UPI002623179E|nr:TVP38/TMEM64 family protein [Breoghania sp.]MDJ0930012.1 TVP38/TMEM64 family protein [Breoghania sp.]